MQAMLIKQKIYKVALTLVVALMSLPLVAQENAEGFDGASAISSEMKFWLLIGMFVFQIILLFTVANIIKSFTGNAGMWKKILNAKNTAAILVIGFLLSAETASAQSSAEAISFTTSESIHNLLIALNGLLLLGIIIMLYTLKKLVNTLTVESHGEKEFVSLWDKLMVKMTDAVPVEEEEDVLTDHHYDGIQELDNNLPPWWVLGFYITIACAVLYVGYYEFYLGGNISKQEYQAEMQQAAEEREAFLASLGSSIDESNVVAMDDASSLAEGKESYTTYCATCHGQEGEGIAGPNLTDPYWLHGGGIKNVFKTIKYGVAGKAMIAWEDQMTPPQMQKVASYVLTLQGNNPENAKAPEGDLWKPEGGMEEAPADSTVSDSTAAEAVDGQVAEL